MSEVHHLRSLENPYMKNIVSHILQHVHMIVPDIRTGRGREDSHSDLSHLDLARLDSCNVNKGELNAHFLRDILRQMRDLVMDVL